MNEIEMSVQGMSCAHCVRAVTQAIQARDAAAAVTIDLPAGLLRATTMLPREAVAAAVREEGYDVAG